MPNANLRNFPLELRESLAEFPDALQELVTMELQSGNLIVSISSGHPAAPCGQRCEAF